MGFSCFSFLLPLFVPTLSLCFPLFSYHSVSYSGGCTSLPRGKHGGQVSMRDCATLPRGFGSDVVQEHVTFFPPSGPLLATPSALHMNASSSSVTSAVPTVVTRKMGVVRRASRRQSVYAESIYGEVEQAIAEANRAANG